MAKRVNYAAALKKPFDDAKQGTGVHPLRGVLADENQARVLLIPLDEIEPNPDQPRKYFDEAALEELAASVKEKGILQPIIVHKKPGSERCVIVVGERRWRAAKMAGLTEVPALVRTPADAKEVAIIENLQRQNLNPMEEAEAFLDLKTTRGYTDAELAKIIGKSRVNVTQTLALTRLPDHIKADIRQSMSDVGHWPKSQLLQVVQAGSPEKMEAAWQALRTGEATTVRDLRQEKKKGEPVKGRPKHYRFDYKPKDDKYQVLVIFPKKTASRGEVRTALKAALKNLPKHA